MNENNLQFIYNFMNLKSVQEKQRAYKTFTADQKQVFEIERYKIYNEVNKDEISAKKKVYRETNKDKINKNRRKRYKLKKDTVQLEK